MNYLQLLRKNLIYDKYIELIDGSVIAVRPDPSVTTPILRKILEWRKSGIQFDDIIDRL